MFLFLTVVQALVAAMLVGVILVQKSEGGGLGVGGNSSGLMTARGAADFLTRATSVLATLFVVLAIVLAALAVKGSGGGSIDTSLQRGAAIDPLAKPVLAASATPAASSAAPAPLDPLAAPKK